ncbi:MAG: ferrous iron transport protein A [Micrococcales bacterium]|nr:ferrous iron transport protein A [Micrococcales bacterium]
MNLSALPAGRDARIVGLDVEPGLALRMGELGLRVGTVVRVTHHGGLAGRVVAVGSDRFALDLDACRGVRLAAAP